MYHFFNVDKRKGKINRARNSAKKNKPKIEFKTLRVIFFSPFQILQCGGNLFDAVGAAVKAALYNTEIPRVITATLDGGEPDIQVSDDPYDCIKLDVTNYPVVLTVCKVCNNLQLFFK